MSHVRIGEREPKSAPAGTVDTVEMTREREQTLSRHLDRLKEAVILKAIDSAKFYM
jgi:hypothetical protein